MNIFVLSIRHHISATALVVNLPSYCPQLSCMSYRKTTGVRFYKKTHENHPCSSRARERKVVVDPLCLNPLTATTD